MYSILEALTCRSVNTKYSIPPEFHLESSEGKNASCLTPLHPLGQSHHESLCCLSLSFLLILRLSYGSSQILSPTSLPPAKHCLSFLWYPRIMINKASHTSLQRKLLHFPLYPKLESPLRAHTFLLYPSLEASSWWSQTKELLVRAAPSHQFPSPQSSRHSQALSQISAPTG